MQIHSALYNSTLETIKKSGLPYEIVFDNPGSEKSFGEKLYSAVRGEFLKGAENLLIIGNDCPQLSFKHLQEGASKLERGETVIGPDRRGGIYLLGISKETFEKIDLVNLPWQTTFLFNALNKEISVSGSCCVNLLRRLSDINTSFDLDNVRNWLSDYHSLKIIYKSIANRILNIERYQSTMQSRILSYFGLRAPPVAF